IRPSTRLATSTAQDPKPVPSKGLRARIKGAGQIFKHLPATFALVWKADRGAVIAVGALTILAALLPAAIAWVGKLIVDGVVRSARSGLAADRQFVYMAVLGELGLMVLSTAVSRTQGLVRELLRANLGNIINEQILQKALELELRHFEDSDTYDKMQNA